MQTSKEIDLISRKNPNYIMITHIKSVEYINFKLKTIYSDITRVSRYF